MKITFISLFPEIFTSFLATSLIKKALEKGVLQFAVVNPRDFCLDKHKQVDDEIYGGGAGLLIKAKPVIDAVESVMTPGARIVFLSPSKEIFSQMHAHGYSQCEHLILVCGRYEGIDARFEQVMRDRYGEQFSKLSLGQFVTLGGEMPALVMVEAIVRLVPGVIKEKLSWEDESYSPACALKNLEYPQYTRPEEIFWYTVPEVLLSGDLKRIAQRKASMTENMGS